MYFPCKYIFLDLENWINPSKNYTSNIKFGQKLFETNLVVQSCHFSKTIFLLFKKLFWASLVVQWLRMPLPMQGTWVRALVQEDPTCCRAAKPVYYSYLACAQSPQAATAGPPCLQLWKPACLEPMIHKRSHSSWLLSFRAVMSSLQ